MSPSTISFIHRRKSSFRSPARLPLLGLYGFRPRRFMYILLNCRNLWSKLDVMLLDCRNLWITVGYVYIAIYCAIVTGRRGQAWIHQRADGYLLRSIAGD